MRHRLKGAMISPFILASRCFTVSRNSIPSKKVSINIQLPLLLFVLTSCMKSDLATPEWQRPIVEFGFK